MSVRPTGDVVAIVTANNVVWFRNLADGRAVGKPITNVDAPIYAVAFSPDGSRLAVGTASGTVRQYDAVTHEPLGGPPRRQPTAVGGVAYSPDGAVLAGTHVGFSTTRLWDARTGRPIGGRLTGGRVPYSYQTFLVDRFIPSRPAFAADGRVLLTPGFPGASVRWNLEPAVWTRAACGIAGRDLSREEWERYMSRRAFRSLCQR